VKGLFFSNVEYQLTVVISHKVDDLTAVFILAGDIVVKLLDSIVPLIQLCHFLQ
jgi:hypothetical protein